MSKEQIHYWRNWIENKEAIPITEDGYIVRFTMANRHSNIWVKQWVSCTSKKKLYAFIKYVLVPSVIFSKTIGLKDGEVYLDVCEYNETIGVLEHLEEETYEKAVENYIAWFEEIENLENKDEDFNEIRSFISKITSENDFKQGLFLEINLYENITTVGRNLIKEYEEDDMLDELEDIMELRAEEIIDLFDNINGNKFMMRKITTLLNEKFV